MTAKRTFYILRCCKCHMIAYVGDKAKTPCVGQELVCLPGIEAQKEVAEHFGKCTCKPEAKQEDGELFEGEE